LMGIGSGVPTAVWLFDGEKDSCAPTAVHLCTYCCTLVHLPSHLHTFTPSHLHTFTPSHLHTFTPSHLRTLCSCTRLYYTAPIATSSTAAHVLNR
jgi:hypothetical protein